MDFENERIIRVMLIEPQAIVRAGLRLLIQSDPRLTVAAEAGTCDEALLAIESDRPDVVLIEPYRAGESCARLITELAAAVRVIVLTAEHQPEFHQFAIRHGAMGLVLKDQPAKMLLKAIHKVYNGEMWVERSLMTSVISEMCSDRRGQAAGPASGIAALTPREREICELVAEGLNNQQIADRLFLSKATVRHHITSIFANLEVPDRVGLLIYFYKSGMVKPWDRPGFLSSDS